MRSRYRCSMCPAIHITSRSWLRSSSTHEPSDPPLRVLSRSSLKDTTSLISTTTPRGPPKTGVPRRRHVYSVYGKSTVVKKTRKKQQRALGATDNTGDRHQFFKPSPRRRRTAVCRFSCRPEAGRNTGTPRRFSTMYNSLSSTRRHDSTDLSNPPRIASICMKTHTLSAVRCPYHSGFSVRSQCAALGRRDQRELGNDPSAGSPTETLLRLLLPLNDQV